MARAFSAALLAAAAFAGCSAEYGNPFAANSPTVVPPASADIVFVSNLHDSRTGREIFAIDDQGGTPTRLTFCTTTIGCDHSEVAFAPDRVRGAVRHRDGGADDGLFMRDFARSVEGPLVAATSRVTGVDWSTNNVIVYSANGTGGVEDLFRMEANGLDARNLTASAVIRERRGHVDPTGAVAVFERIAAAGQKSEIWVFFSTQAQAQLTRGGEGTGSVGGVPIGSDADPDYSPDGRSVVFRRLRAAGASSLGDWDIATIRTDGTALSVIVTGAGLRGPPDWGPGGILFTERDEAGETRLLVVDASGGNRRVVASVPAGQQLSAPRWLP